MTRKRLGDEIFDAVDERAEALFDVGAAGHEEKRNVAGGLAAAQFFEELAAVEARHFVIAEDEVGRLVDDFEEGVGAIVGEDHFADRFQGFEHEVADKRIVFGQEQLDAFAGRRAHRGLAL